MDRDELAFTYFPDNYRWSHGLLLALGAAHYYHVGERFLVPKTADGLAAYKRGVDCFRDGARRARRPRIEPVEVPYEGTSLPALFVHAEGGARRSPALVFFDGFDVTKEIQYFKGRPDLR